MNMPNLAWCHQAMRAARVAAWLERAGLVWSGVGGACRAWGGLAEEGNASVFAAVMARALAAPICIKNERLEFSFISMGVCLGALNSIQRLGSSSRRGKYSSRQGWAITPLTQKVISNLTG